MYIPKPKEYLDLPTWRSTPLGKMHYLKNMNDILQFVENAKNYYTLLRSHPDAGKKDIEEALHDYEEAKQFAIEAQKKEIRIKERPQEQFVFPLEFSGPSGHKYVFKDFNELKNLEDPKALEAVLEYQFKHGKSNRSKEQILPEIKKDIEFLRKKRQEVYDKGWLNAEDAWKKGLTGEEEYLEREKRKKLKEQQELQAKEEQLQAKYRRAGVTNELDYQRAVRAREEALKLALSNPPQATAAPQQSAPAPVQPTSQPQAQAAASPEPAPQATAAPQQSAPAPAQPTSQPQAQASAAPQERRTRENFYGINEPNYPLNVTFPENLGNFPRNINIANNSHYESIKRILEDELIQAHSERDRQKLKDLAAALKHVESEHTNALNQRRANETPAYVTNPDGSVIDTRTHEVVDPERVQLASAQERSRQLANRPFEPNPFEGATEVDPLLQQGINSVQQEQQNQQAAAQAPANNFEYPERTNDQEEAVQNYTNPARRDRRYETLRDRFLEASRNRAVRRFQDSMQDLGRMYSANRMGRNSMFEHQMGRAFRDTLQDMNVLDAQTEMNLMNMEEQHGGNRARFAEGQYGTDAARALEQYRENQLREERLRNRQRQAASDAIAAGTLRQNFNEQNRSRQSAEFMRRQGHPRAELNSHLDTLRAASHGLPQMQQEERMNVPAPRFVPQAAPPTLERENAPYGQQMPAQPPAPAPDTTFRDVAGVLLGAGELGMNMAANRRAEEAHRAAQASNLAGTFQGRSQGGARSTA